MEIPTTHEFIRQAFIEFLTVCMALEVMCWGVGYGVKWFWRATEG